jgi:hypothetical protein
LGANPDSLDLPGLHGPDLLEVRIPPCLGLVVGMTDIVPGDRFFSADFTRPCHGALLVICLVPAISGWLISKFIFLLERNKKGKWFFESDLLKGDLST